MTHPDSHLLQRRSELYLGRVPDTLPTRTDWFFCPCWHHKYRGKGPGSVPLVWLLQQRKEVPGGSQIWNLQRFHVRIKHIIISCRQTYKILFINKLPVLWVNVKITEFPDDCIHVVFVLLRWFQHFHIIIIKLVSSGLQIYQHRR